jgi:transglutaminase-like putative cysteine protease
MKSNKHLKPRSIDQRFKPPVRGIDFVEAMNYIQIKDVGIDFIYDNYTSVHLGYIPGKEMELEAVVAQAISDLSDPLDIVQKLATFVSQKILWAGYYEKQTGKRLPTDRNLSEREILQTGYGWCNEQARVLCYLTQIAGFASRLIFAGDRHSRYGHVITEVLLPSGWLAVDQSFGFCFLMNSYPVRAYNIYNNQKMRPYFQPIYMCFCEKLQTALGKEILKRDFTMAVAEDPLDGFEVLGYHNHYII